MFRNRCIASATLVIAMSIISACSATKGYDGPTRSSDELATVKAFGVEFYFVNGKAVSATSSGLSLLPGHNQIEFTVNASNFNAAQDGKKRMILNVNLEAGKTYAVTGPRGGGGLCAYPLNSAGDPIYEEPAGCLGDS